MIRLLEFHLSIPLWFISHCVLSLWSFLVGHEWFQSQCILVCLCANTGCCVKSTHPSSVLCTRIYFIPNSSKCTTYRVTPAQDPPCNWLYKFSLQSLLKRLQKCKGKAERLTVRGQNSLLRLIQQEPALLICLKLHWHFFVHSGIGLLQLQFNVFQYNSILYSI